MKQPSKIIITLIGIAVALAAASSATAGNRRTPSTPVIITSPTGIIVSHS